MTRSTRSITGNRNVPECVVGPAYTEHKFLKPFDRCQCGQERWTGDRPRTGLGSMFTLTQAQFLWGSNLATLRNLQDIFDA